MKLIAHTYKKKAVKAKGWKRDLKTLWYKQELQRNQAEGKKLVLQMTSENANHLAF